MRGNMHVRIPAKLNSHSGQREHPDPPQWQGSCRLIFSLGAGAVKWLITGLRLSLGREPSCI